LAFIIPFRHAKCKKWDGWGSKVSYDVIGNNTKDNAISSCY